MFTIKSVVYPEKITKSIAALRHNRSVVDSNAIGTAANFSCGPFVRFSLSIDTQSQIVTHVNFSSNGCGFMLAAADVLAESVINKRLGDLHGLADAEQNEHVKKYLGEIPSERRECVTACIEALRAAFADLRKKQIEEFQGEKALICTCFGVSEETIESILSEPGAIATGPSTVEEIIRATRAGSGCGSCWMLIQEMLDTRLDNI
jgi:NifU-like protein involved in Fe-S cluster formation/bacterioferritin-associated ferredoxin